MAGGTEYHAMNYSGELMARFLEDYRAANPDVVVTAADVDLDSVKMSVYNRNGDQENNPNFWDNGWRENDSWYYMYNVGAFALDETLWNERVSPSDFGGLRITANVKGQPFTTTIGEEKLDQKVVSVVNHGTYDTIIELYLRKDAWAPADKDLTIDKTASQEEVEAGEELSYTLTVTNPNTGAMEFTVTDTLPQDVTFVSAQGAGYRGE